MSTLYTLNAKKKRFFYYFASVRVTIQTALWTGKEERGQPQAAKRETPRLSKSANNKHWEPQTRFTQTGFPNP